MNPSSQDRPEIAPPLPTGPRGLWEGLIVGLTCAAVMLCIRLSRSAKRQILLKEMRVEG